MMLGNKHPTLVDVLCNTLIPNSLQSVCATSLKLIENASSNQVSAAVEYNQNKINTFLIQLLTINFISQNRQQIENDLNKLINPNDIVQLSPSEQVNPIPAIPNATQSIVNHSASATLTLPIANVDMDLKEYCERKLLSLSPILGFSRKNYFVEYNISNDIQMEIISYLKPIEIFKNITLTSQQFNENVQIMHQSYKHGNVFCSKHYVFESFNKVKKYCEKSNDDNRNIDWELADGQWVHAWIDGIDSNMRQVHLGAKVGDRIVRGKSGYGQVAPACSMSFRPGNRSKFVNILKHGYCSESCDVNLKNCSFWLESGRPAHLIHGFEDENRFEENTNQDKDTNGNGNGNGNIDKGDIWKCGWIDFEWTLRDAACRNHVVFDTNINICGDENENENEKILESSDNHEQKEQNNNNNNNNNNKSKNKKCGIFQVRVIVDITEEYNKLDDLIVTRINELFDLRKTRQNRWVISLVFHSDDIDNFTYFGSKTTLKQQLEIQKYLFNTKFERDNSGGMHPAKAKLLHSLNYPNYCVVTPNGVFNAMSDNLEERKQFNKWYTILNDGLHEAEIQNFAMSSNAINKVYYDKENDELCVKLLAWFSWIVEDSNAPAPLEKRYFIPHGNGCRLINAKIVDPGLIDKVKMENIKDVDRKEERYFELLREWKGYIIVGVDITDEFNQFQERIKNEYIKFHDNNNNNTNNNKQSGSINSSDDKKNKIKWDNRKYFLNNDEMPYLKYNKKEDKITRDVYVLLNSKRVYSFDAKFNLFDILVQREEEVLENIFRFVRVPESFDNGFLVVCKDWHRIADAQEWDRFLGRF